MERKLVSPHREQWSVYVHTVLKEWLVGARSKWLDWTPTDLPRRTDVGSGAHNVAMRNDEDASPHNENRSQIDEIPYRLCIMAVQTEIVPKRHITKGQRSEHKMDANECKLGVQNHLNSYRERILSGCTTTYKSMHSVKWAYTHVWHACL